VFKLYVDGSQLIVSRFDKFETAPTLPVVIEGAGSQFCIYSIRVRSLAANADNKERVRHH
jgi:hypothetical protein